MEAFTNTTYTKEQTIDLIDQHIKMDALISGNYWDEDSQTGCHVGCLIHSDDHSLFEPHFGIDQGFAELCDAIHEGLPDDDSRTTFFQSALPSIPVGADTTRIYHQFMHWMLVDPAQGVIRFAGDDQQVIDAIESVATLHLRGVNSDMPTNDEWAVASDAASDAASAVASAAASDAASAAASAAARAAASAVARYAAWSAARAAHFGVMANNLIEICRQADS